MFPFEPDARTAKGPIAASEDVGEARGGRRSRAQRIGPAVERRRSEGLVQPAHERAPERYVGAAPPSALAVLVHRAELRGLRRRTVEAVEGREYVDHRARAGRLKTADAARRAERDAARGLPASAAGERRRGHVRKPV